MKLIGGGWSWMGVKPTPVSDDGPLRLQGAGHVLPLGKYARVMEGRLWLFRELRRPEWLHTTTSVHQSDFTQTLKLFSAP
jgi:hypothetical protein